MKRRIPAPLELIGARRLIVRLEEPVAEANAELDQVLEMARMDQCLAELDAKLSAYRSIADQLDRLAIGSLDPNSRKLVAGFAGGIRKAAAITRHALHADWPSEKNPARQRMRMCRLFRKIDAIESRLREFLFQLAA